MTSKEFLESEQSRLEETLQRRSLTETQRRATEHELAVTKAALKTAPSSSGGSRSAPKKRERKLTAKQREFLENNPDYTYTRKPSGSIIFHKKGVELDITQSGKVWRATKKSEDVYVAETKEGKVTVSEGVKEKIEEAQLQEKDRAKYYAFSGGKAVGVSKGVYDVLNKKGKKDKAYQEAQLKREQQVEAGIVKPPFKERVKRKYQKAEAWAREHITYPLMPETKTLEQVEKDIDAYKKYEGKTPFEMAIEATVTPQPKSIMKLQAGYAHGFYNDLRNYPVKAGAFGAISIAAPEIVGALGTAGSTIGSTLFLPSAGTKALASGVKTGLKYGLPVAYAGITAKRVAETEGGGIQKAAKLGGITSTEILPSLAGSYAGAKLRTTLPYQRFKSRFRVQGRSELSQETMIPKDVLSGKERFPTAGRGVSRSKRALIHKRLFEKESFRLPEQKKPMMYHATPQEWDDLVTKAGSSEFKGTYGSYGLSPHFLKIEKPQISFYRGSISPYRSPKLMPIEPDSFVIGTSAPRGSAFIPATKTEVEAIIPPNTKLKEIPELSGKYFVKWKGVRVPIDAYRTGGLGAGGGTAGGISWRGSYSPASIDVLSSGSFLGSGSLGLISGSSLTSDLKPSEISSMSRGSRRVSRISFSSVTSRGVSSFRSSKTGLSSGLTSPSMSSISQPVSSPSARISKGSSFGSAVSSYGADIFKGGSESFGLGDLPRKTEFGKQKSFYSGRKLFPQPRGYKPSIAGIFTGKRRGKKPKDKLTTGIEIRLPL